MTREEKKRLRMQIIQLLDECDGCRYKTKLGASVEECKKCPIGKKLNELSSMLENKKKRTDAKLWREEEERFLAENHSKMKYKNIAQKLGRTPKAIKAKVNKMRQAGLIQEKTNNKLRS